MVSAGQKTSFTAKTQVSWDEVFTWNTIAITEKQVICLRSQYTFIQNITFTESFIFVPYMLHLKGQLRSYPLQHIISFFPRTIIGNNQFKVLSILGFISPQHLLQPFKLVAGWQYDRHLQRSSLPAKTDNRIIALHLFPSPIKFSRNLPPSG